MLNLISCELLKLKRSKMVLISVAGVLSTPLLMLIEALQTHFDKPEIKDLGGTLRRTSKTTLWSYDSRASGDRNVPIARGAWQMWRVNFSKSDTMRWQLRLPAHSCDFESNNHIFDRKGDHLWKN